MPTTSQHSHTRQRRLKSPLHALHGAIAASNATDALAPGDLSPENDGKNLVATFASADAPVAANAADKDGFALIAPLGNHSHPVGLQLVDSAAVANMVARHHSAIARVVRFFGSAAVPVYQGHPDDVSFGDSHEDTTRYGEAVTLQQRPDGLYAKIEWTAAGNALLNAGKKLYYSPRWLMAPADAGGNLRSYRPYKLLSIGLTPTPNIAGAAANEQQPKSSAKMNKLLEALLLRLGFTTTQAAAAAANEATAPAEAEVLAAIDKLTADLAAANAAKDKAEGDLAAANAAKAKVEADLAAANTTATEAATAANAKLQSVAKLIVGQAIKAGVITAANEQAEIDLLLGHSDIPAAANALLARQPVVKTQAAVDAAARTAEGSICAANAAALEFEAKVTAIVANESIGRDEAWVLAKTRHADLWAQMSAKTAGA